MALHATWDVEMIWVAEMPCMLAAPWSAHALPFCTDLKAKQRPDLWICSKRWVSFTGGTSRAPNYDGSIMHPTFSNWKHNFQKDELRKCFCLTSARKEWSDCSGPCCMIPSSLTLAALRNLNNQAKLQQAIDYMSRAANNNWVDLLLLWRTICCYGLENLLDASFSLFLVCLKLHFG